jgi:hypothetical protein
LEQTKINQFKHFQSAHCENGVTASLLKNQGIDFLTEPLAFGIGAGLFYIHVPFMKFSGGPAISFRSMPGTVFSRTCKALEIPLVRKKFNDEAKAKLFLDKLLEENKIAGLQVGVFHLNYLAKEYRFHFNAHNLVVYGKENDTYLISDPVMENVTTLDSETLNKVRFAKGTLAPKGHIYYPKEHNHDISRETIQKAIAKGIKTNAFYMTKIPTAFMLGTRGIRYTAGKVKDLKNKMSIKQAGLYLGQIVRMQEEIGTGGGGFRFMYSAFLEQAYDYVQNDRLLKISEDLTKSGDLWRHNAVRMAGVFKGRTIEQKHFDEIAEVMVEISHIEEKAFLELGKLKLV